MRQVVGWSTGGATAVYSGSVPLGDEVFNVSCVRCRHGYRLRVEGVAELTITGDGSFIEASPVPGVEPLTLQIVIFGPALTLALACQGVLCLHASATASGDRARLFLGESGSGKSTLVRLLEGHGGPGARRATDDITPVELRDDGPAVLPHFPQLKLAAPEQWGPDDPARLAWAAACFLGEGPEVRVTPVSAHAATAMLMRHLVGLPLFDPDLRQRAVELCAAFASRMPMRLLTYPRRFAALPEVERVLGEGFDLGRSARSGK